MRRLELKEYQQYPQSVPLDRDELRALTASGAHIQVMPSPEVDGAYMLRPSSYIGAVNIGDMAIVVRPKIPIDRVMFLVTYSMDPKHWRKTSVELKPEDGILEAIIFAFTHHTRQAIHRGLLRGYRREEDALNTVRGRIRFGDQVQSRFDIPLPVEVAFDEFTEDIEKNRLLKAAIERLGHTFIRSQAARQEVRRLRPSFSAVGLDSYPRGAIPEVSYTRLDEHYRPAVELARLILDNSSLELQGGKVAGASFLIDMNKVFERFLYVGLREALGLRARQWRHEACLMLDEQGHIGMKPDFSWWTSAGAGDGSMPLFVGDAKYKKPEGERFEHADIYQMLAYCTAADLSSGTLVYAAGEGEPRIHKVRHADIAIEVETLNLEGSPEAILKEIGQLSNRIRNRAFQCPSNYRTPGFSGSSITYAEPSGSGHASEAFDDGLVHGR